MLKVGVLVSGGGTNLQAILDAIDSGKITNAEISLVISNNPNAYALERAKNHNIEAVCISPKQYESREEFHKVLLEKLKESGADIAYVMPSHQYPLGIVMPIKRRQELLRWAEDTGGTIIEDDYDSEFRLQGKPIPSLFSIDATDKVIYFNTFTKSLAATIRISYMVLPLPLLERFKSTLGFYACTVSNFEQYTLAAFMNAGAFEKHINRLRNYYQHKRDLILSTFLREPLGKYITISEEDSGVHFLMHVNTSMSEQEFLLKTRAKGIRLATLSSFYNAEQKDSRYENTYVMNYSFVDCDRLEYVAQTLYKIIHP